MEEEFLNLTIYNLYFSHKEGGFKSEPLYTLFEEAGVLPCG